MKRYTFVVQVHPGGISTLENLSTHERIRLPDIAAIGGQIEEWLGELPSDPEISLGDGSPPRTHPPLST